MEKHEYNAPYAKAMRFEAETGAQARAKSNDVALARTLWNVLSEGDAKIPVPRFLGTVLRTLLKHLKFRPLSVLFN